MKKGEYIMAEKGKGLYRKTESIYNIKPLGEKNTGKL